MKKGIGIGCGVLILLAVLMAGCAAVIGTSGNTASTPGSPAASDAVTLAEYEQVTEGMTRAEVEGIFNAKQISNSSTDLGGGMGRIDTISYSGEGFGDMVIINYDKAGKVTSKSQSGLN